jgi:hypothetical protein
MRITFPYLMALAKRMVPGVFEDPLREIGTCRFCERTVTYAEGTLDDAGHASHDACAKTVRHRQLDRVRASGIFRHVLGIVRDLPTVLPEAKTMLHDMPNGYGPVEMAGFIDAMIPHVSLEPSLSLRSRRDTVVALRDTKRLLLGLSVARNETRPC